MKLLSRRVALSAPTAILLSIIVASQAIAHSWPGSAQLSTASYPPGGVATDGSVHSVATFVEWNGNGYDVKAVHSGASGWSWESTMTLSTDGFGPAVSALGQYFDVVFEQDSRVRYARSTNYGTSFGASVALTPAGSPLPTLLSVGRGNDGLVVVSWQNVGNGSIKTRVSTNGGVTFGTVKTISTGQAGHYSGTAAAAGNGVAYVAYSPTGTTLFVARTTNGGATWSSQQISTTPWDFFETAHAQFSVTAEGSNAYIAYAVGKAANPSAPTVRYKRTTNGGVAWSSEMNLAPPKWKTWEPDIALQGGVLRAVYTRIAGTPSTYYRQSSDGLAWSSNELVAYGDTPGVGYAGSVVLVYRYIYPDYGVYALAGS